MTMNLENLQSVLTDTFNANFVSYYRAHVAHVNIQGRNFHSDHELLGEIYADLSDNIDVLAEKLRTIRALMPDNLADVVDSVDYAVDAIEGTSDEILAVILEDQDRLIDQYHDLNSEAELVGYVDIANYAQDRIAQHAKWRWMIESTLEI